MSEACLLLRIARGGLLHAPHVSVVERLVPLGRGDGGGRAGDVGVETGNPVEVGAHAARGLRAYITRVAVRSEHDENTPALLPRVRVVVLARRETELLEDRSVELVHEAAERRVGGVADDVARDPPERIRDRGDDGSVLFPAERLETVHEGREPGLAVTGERPEVVDEVLLGAELADPLIEPLRREVVVEAEAVKAASA